MYVGQNPVLDALLAVTNTDISRLSHLCDTTRDTRSLLLRQNFTMPESRETLAAWLLIYLALLELLRNHASLNVLALWADASKPEAKFISEAADGHVYRLDASSQVKRGNKSHQTPLWPPMFSQNSDLATLNWRGARTTSRAIILNLGPLYLQVFLLLSITILVFNTPLASLPYPHIDSAIY